MYSVTYSNSLFYHFAFFMLIINRFLYEKVKNGTAFDHGVCFVSTSAISGDGRTQRFVKSDDAARAISDRLFKRNNNNLLIMAYNPGSDTAFYIIFS